MAMAHRGSFGFVYVADVDGVTKIGFTSDVDRRMRQQGGVLIASAPGSYVQEQHLIRLCAGHRSTKPYTAGREWFLPSVWGVLPEAWERMFGFSIQMAAA
jgi:hypothetical protein